MLAHLKMLVRMMIRRIIGRKKLVRMMTRRIRGRNNTGKNGDKKDNREKKCW